MVTGFLPAIDNWVCDSRATGGPLFPNRKRGSLELYQWKPGLGNNPEMAERHPPNQERMQAGSWSGLRVLGVLYYRAAAVLRGKTRLARGTTGNVSAGEAVRPIPAMGLSYPAVDR